MSAPLIAVPIFVAANAAAAAETYTCEAHQKEFDPVAAGFDDFAEDPLETRRTTMEDVYFRGDETDIAHSENARKYLGAIAHAAVDTATSTGRTEITSALLRRSITKHYGYEAKQRHMLATTTLYAELQALRSDLNMRGRGKLNAFRSHPDLSPEANTLLMYSNGYYGNVADARTLTRHSQNAQRDIPTGEAFPDSSLSLEDLSQLDPGEAAVLALQRLPQRLVLEASTIGAARKAVAEAFPSFGQTQIASLQ